MSIVTGAHTRVCHVDDLTLNLGVAAIVGTTQVAVFRLDDGRIFAVQNLCPFSGASVMSRGITGSRQGVPTIASPIYKQVFSLVDGTCLATMDKVPVDGLSPHLLPFVVTVEDGWVLVASA